MILFLLAVGVAVTIGFMLYAGEPGRPTWWLGFFPFAEDKSLLYTLPAIAGLAGATLRIPNSFMIAISGGRNVIFVTSLLL